MGDRLDVERRRSRADGSSAMGGTRRREFKLNSEFHTPTEGKICVVASDPQKLRLNINY